MPPKPKKKRPGPAPKRPEDRAKIVSTSVPATVKAWIESQGKLTAVLRTVILDAYHRAEKKEIEKS